MSQIKNITGLKFGRLTVLELSHKTRIAYWRCVCECGTITIVAGTFLRFGKIRSCGCLQKESAAKIGWRNRTHGMTSHRLNGQWQNMMSRCYNPKNVSYANYGGRGIKVCSRWLWFPNFVEDMDASWKNGLTIERTNNNGDYTPKNCIWANMITQANNTRKNRIVVLNGKRMTATEAAREVNIKPHTILCRAARGWDATRLFSPIRKKTK